MAAVSMSKQEFIRLEVLLGVQSGRLRVADACALIGLRRRQVFRLLRGVKQNGAASLPSRHRGKPSNGRLPAEVRTLALSLVRDRYPTLARPWRRRSWQRSTAAQSRGRRVARLDDRGRAVDRSAAPPALAASAAPAARLPGRTGADRRLGARLVRDARQDVHPAGVRRRCDEPVDGAAFRCL
jgi:hypothetical protein